MEDEKNLKNESEEVNATEDVAVEMESDTEISDRIDEIETIEETPEKKKGKLAVFFSSLAAGIVDTVVVAVISGALLYLSDYIMRYTIGLYISDRIAFLFIIFAIVTVLYTCFMETFNGKTLGKGLIKAK